jgi:ribonuclease G
MNKELFVSSTPHETKVGLVEDDLLAEIYLERENEYTLAGSIYKGRVTRVLPGMQSAFVDVGLERDAFLYVSDFMELEEHDEDLTDVVPANRGVQDMRVQSPRAELASSDAQSAEGRGTDAAEAQASFENGSAQNFEATDAQHEMQPSDGTAPDATSGGTAQDRERGAYRGRRRRRGGRRDGRGDSRGDGRDRGPEPRAARTST